MLGLVGIGRVVCEGSAGDGAHHKKESGVGGDVKVKVGEAVNEEADTGRECSHTNRGQLGIESFSVGGAQTLAIDNYQEPDADGEAD